MVIAAHLRQPEAVAVQVLVELLDRCSGLGAEERAVGPSGPQEVGLVCRRAREAVGQGKPSASATSDHECPEPTARALTCSRSAARTISATSAIVEGR